MPTKIHSVGGNLAGDPELKFLPSGRAVCNFIVLEQPKKLIKETNEWVDNGSINRFKCEAWGTLAENIVESFHKGDPVVLEATQYGESWDDPNTKSGKAYGSKYVVDNLLLDTRRTQFTNNKQSASRNQNQGGQSQGNRGGGQAQQGNQNNGQWNQNQGNGQWDNQGAGNWGPAQGGNAPF